MSQEQHDSNNDIPCDRPPIPPDTPEMQDWIAARREFRDAAVRVGCIDNGIGPGPGVSVDVLHQQHSEAGIKLHIATVRVLEVCKESCWSVKLPVEEVTGLTIDVALARTVALRKNEERLVFEGDAITIMLQSIQEELQELRKVVYQAGAQ